MKRILASLIMLSALVSVAQQEVVQTGTPALLEAPNGKKIKVFLQRLENGNITFQPFKSPNDMTVPAAKIKSLEFFPKYDAESVKALYGNGDYEEMLSMLEPVMAEYAPYMSIMNNMRDAFTMMFDAYLRSGDYVQIRNHADTLIASNEARLKVKAEAALALAAIAEGDFSVAEKIRGELESPAAALYLKAMEARAQDDPTEALKTIADIIASYANDMDWLPDSELLAAYCYLDMTGTNSVITTNSAMYTARQVKNMYDGTPVAADARKLWASLGGEAIEAERAAKKAELKAEMEAAAQAAKERREAARQAQLEARAAARAAAASGTNSTNNIESEQGNGGE